MRARPASDYNEHMDHRLPTLPEAALHVHTEHIAIRWGDMDAMNHVNNTIYFRYMEQARIAWVARLIGALDASCAEGPLIVNASCTFKRPLTAPGTVEVRMYLADPGRTSIGSYYELYVDSVMHADGASRMVWMDLQANRPKPLPHNILALFARDSTVPGEKP